MVYNKIIDEIIEYCKLQNNYSYYLMKAYAYDNNKDEWLKIMSKDEYRKDLATFLKTQRYRIEGEGNFEHKLADEKTICETARFKYTVRKKEDTSFLEGMSDVLKSIVVDANNSGTNLYSSCMSVISSHIQRNETKEQIAKAFADNVSYKARYNHDIFRIRLLNDDCVSELFNLCYNRYIEKHDIS